MRALDALAIGALPLRCSLRYWHSTTPVQHVLGPGLGSLKQFEEGKLTFAGHLQDLAEACMHVKPKQRPTFHQIMDALRPHLENPEA